MKALFALLLLLILILLLLCLRRRFRVESTTGFAHYSSRLGGRFS